MQKKKKSKFFRFFIEIFDDHKSAKSAVRSFLQSVPNSAQRDVEDSAVEKIRRIRKNEYTGFSLITTFL